MRAYATFRQIVRLCVSALLVTAMGSSADAAPDERFTFGFDLNNRSCGQVIRGESGATIRLNATVVVTADEPGIKGWTVAIGVEGDVVAGVGFDACDRDCAAELIGKDLFFNAPESIPPDKVPTSGPLKGQAQGFGLVDGIVVKVGQVLDAGDTSIFEFWVDVTIPTQPGVQELRLVFQDGLQGGGIPIVNRVTFAEDGALPSTLDVLRTSCTLLVSSGGNVNFRRGDDDGNGKLEVTDPIVSLTFQFVGGVHPLCLDALDFDDSGVIDISDAIASLTRQFLGGPPPKKPGIESCGPDPATPPDNLDCIAYDSCDV